MQYKYHCACCEKTVQSTEKVCHHCGSQSIRTPYGFWLFCIFACLMVAIVFNVARIYLQDHESVPIQQGFLSTLEQSNHKNL